MEAAIRSETILRDNSRNSIPPFDDTKDEYYYGYRTLIDYDENGKTIFSYRPLTLDDFLEPEEGDVYMQGNLHERDIDRLKSIFRYHLKERGNITVYSDMKIEWDIDGLPNPAPDISIIANVKNPEAPRGTFNVHKEGTKPFFILEVVSPRYREADVDRKPGIYWKAGVSEYIIVDSNIEGQKIYYSIFGYRLIGGRYTKIKPDTQGRIISQTTSLKLGVSEDRSQIIVYNSRTNELILSDEERADQEKERADQEKERADQEKERADQEKERADQEKSLNEQEKARADSAEDELQRLKAKLKDLGISAY